MKRLPAFSLVEIAIGLFILGLLLTAIMKGSKLIDAAKMQTCVHQIIGIKHDFEVWHDDQKGVVDVKRFPLAEKRTKLGGVFLLETDAENNNRLAMTNSVGNGFLSPSQAREIQRYFPEAVSTGCDMNGIEKTCRVSVPLG